MIWYIILAISILLSSLLINSAENKTINYNPYNQIISWNYTEEGTTTWSSDCLTWKIIDIWIKDYNLNKEYLFFPDKTWNDNTYDDWYNNINVDDCINELKKNYKWHFNIYKIDSKGIRMEDSKKNKLIIWKYLFE